MTAYDSFRHRQVALQAMIFVAFVTFSVSSALSAKYDSLVLSALTWIGWIGLIACALLLYSGSRCPRCQAKMRDVPISCPKCGLNLTLVEPDAEKTQPSDEANDRPLRGKDEG